MSTTDTRPRGSRVRRAWLVVGTAITIVLLTYGTLQAVTQIAHDEYVVTHSFPAGEIAVVDVESDAGTVQIVGSDAGDAVVTEHVSDGLRATHHSVEVVGDRLVVRVGCPGFLSSFCHVDATLRVPSDVRVVVRAHDDVTVSDVSGDVDVESSHGTVDLRHASGSTLTVSTEHGDVDATDLASARVKASSVHGSVDLELIESPDGVDASSEHGDVDIVLPASPVAYRVDASSEHGSVDTPIRTDPSSDRVIRATSTHGDVSIRYATSG